MLRASYLPPVASSSLNALRSSLIPALKFSSPSVSTAPSYFTFRKISSLVPPRSITRQLRVLWSGYHHSFSFSRGTGMAAEANPCTAARASYSSGSTTEGGREILVQHLLVKENDLNLLVEIQKRAAEGEDLSDLAVEYSLCPSKDDGGMLGWVKKGQMVPEFEEAAFNAQLNKVVRCKTQFGWHLLQVLSEREELKLLDIQPGELHSKMQDPAFLDEAQLIDVREPEEVAQASLPGFQVLPLQQFGKWGPEITTKFNPDKETYVMCHHGMRSLQMAKWLQSQGFKNVFNVAGGIHAYAVKADPSVPTY